MKTSRISLNQMFTLLVLYLIATLSNIGRLAGQDIWIILLVASVFGAVLFYMYHRISYLHGYDDFTLILKDVFGDFFGRLVIIIYSGFFLYMAFNVLSSTGNMIQFTIMKDASMLLILGLFALVTWYGMMLGVNAIGRASQLLFYLVLISFIPVLIAVFTSDIFSFEKFFPILEDGFQKIIPDIFRTILFPYGELIIFLSIFPLIPKSENEKILKVGLIGVIAGTILLLVVHVINVGILGIDLVYNFIYPFFNAMKMVGIDIFFERLDPLAIIILMTTCFFKTCVYLYAGTSLLNGLSSKLNYRIISLPILAIMCLIGVYLKRSQVENLYQILFFNPRYIFPVFELALPILMWLISEFKYHKHPKQKSETN